MSGQIVQDDMDLPAGVHTAHTAERLLDPHADWFQPPDPPEPGITPEQPADIGQALAWFAAERPVLLAAIEHAAAGRFDTRACQLTWALVDYLDRRGLWHDMASAGRTAVAAAQRLADPGARATCHRMLAHAYLELGRFTDAHVQLRHALDGYRQAGDLTGQARAERKIAAAWHRQGRSAKALRHARRALDLARAADHARERAFALNAVGWYHAHLGQDGAAVTACREALTVFQDLGDREGQTNTWDSLGLAHHHLGQHASAATCFGHALELLRDIGHRYIEAQTLTHLGDSQRAAGRPEAAWDAWQRALVILERQTAATATRTDHRHDQDHIPTIRRRDGPGGILHVYEHAA